MSDHTHADNHHPHLLLSEHARKNRAMWEASSDSYEQRHAISLSGEKAMAWGIWRIPEAELQVLGEVASKDILELGCGAARWSIALARLGARVPCTLPVVHVQYSVQAVSLSLQMPSHLTSSLILSNDTSC
jgi:hypothetical protein